MTETSNKTEIVIVSLGAGIGAVGTYLAASPIPENVKVPLVAVCGAVALFIGVFWAKYVNMTSQVKAMA